MLQVPSKMMQALPPILGFIGAILTIIGTGYEVAGQTDPDIPALLSWPAGLAGLLTQIGAFLLAQNNQAKAAASPPVPPLESDGTRISQTTYLISLAAARAMEEGNHQLVRDLANAMERPKTSFPGQSTTSGKEVA